MIARSIYASALDDLKAGGQFTGGVYGALLSLRSIMSILRSEGFQIGPIVACFDNGVPPSRMRLLPDYKQARRDRKELLSEDDRIKAFGQIGICYDLWQHLGALCLSYRQREADDVVAATTRLFLDRGDRVVVVSSDRDLWQTVAWGATVYDLRDAVTISAENFEGYSGGVPVSRWLLYKALIGDSSDGIKGADGCGPVRSKALLESVDFDDNDDGLAMLRHLCAVLRDRARDGKMRGFEQSVLDHEDHLNRVLRAIDLRESFGPTTKLSDRITQLPPVAPTTFLRACRSLSFSSIIGDPEGTLDLFRQAESRR